MSTRINRQDAEGLCTLTLDRPDKLNALDNSSFQELDAHLAALEGETDRIGCVLLRGKGKAFCAGADLDALGKVPVPPAFKPGVIERLSRLPQPTIAAVHGICYTGGLELALAADFIFADATARFADTHGKWGLVAAWGMTQRLPRRIGPSAAKLMMMTGRIVSAAEALSLGLVDYLAPSAEFEDCLAAFTHDVLSSSWHTNFCAKRLLRETDGMSLAEGLAYEHFHYPGAAPDHQERVARFGERRRNLSPGPPRKH